MFVKNFLLTVSDALLYYSILSDKDFPSLYTDRTIRIKWHLATYSIYQIHLQALIAEKDIIIYN